LKNILREKSDKLLLTSGFTQAGVYARRQFCANLQVHHPLEHLCNPRLREAAGRYRQPADSECNP